MPVTELELDDRELDALNKLREWYEHGVTANRICDAGADNPSSPVVRKLLDRSKVLTEELWELCEKAWSEKVRAKELAKATTETGDYDPFGDEN